MTTLKTAISELCSELQSERELAQELEQELHQRLEESQMLDQERRRLQDQNKQKENFVMKLTSDLEKEKKRARIQTNPRRCKEKI